MKEKQFEIKPVSFEFRSDDSTVTLSLPREDGEDYEIMNNFDQRILLTSAEILAIANLILNLNRQVQPEPEKELSAESE